MFINPLMAIDNGWITGNFTPESIQPNALDFTIDRLYTIDSSKTFIITQDHKEMRGGVPVEPFSTEDELLWKLEANTVYDGMSDFYISVPEGIACMMIIRSTFNRNGIFITSGLYDSGYAGHLGFAIHNRSGTAYIEPGTRIGQIIFVASESAKMYAGGYNHEEGTHHSETK